MKTWKTGLAFLSVMFLFQSCLISKKGVSGLTKIGLNQFGQNGECLTAAMRADEMSNHLEGEYQKEIVDFLKDNGEIIDQENDYLVYQDGSRIQLFDDAKKLSADMVGAKIRVYGYNSMILADGEGFSVDKVQVLSSYPNGDVQEFKTYNLKALSVIMDFNNRVTSSHYSLQRGQEDLQEITDYLKRISGGQIDMNPDTNGDGTPDVEVVKINRNFSSGDCTPKLHGVVRDLLKEHNLSDYTTVIFIASLNSSGNDSTCGYGGVANLGQLGNGTGGSTHIGTPLRNVILHELGHTLGLGHSGQGSCTYCDQVDPMGNYFGNNLQYFNGPKIKQLGLFDDRLELERTLTADGTYTLRAVGYGVSDPDTTPRLLTVKGSTTYYLTYRHPAGEDADWPTSLNKFKGVVVNTGAINSGGQSTYHKVLASNGDSFAGSGVDIKLVSDISGDNVEVQLTFPGGGTPNPPHHNPTCDVTKSSMQLIQAKAAGSEYEVSFKLTNNNDSTCGEMKFDMKVESDDLELISGSVVAVPAGETREGLVRLSKRFTASDPLGGILKATELAGKSNELQVNFEIGQIGSSCE